MLHSLRFRLLLMTVFVSVIAIGAFGLVSSRKTMTEFRRYVESDSATLLESARPVLVEHYLRHQKWENVASVLDKLGRASGRQFILVDIDGQVIATSGTDLSNAQIEVSPDHVVTITKDEEPVTENNANGSSPRRFKARLNGPYLILKGPGDIAIGTLYLLQLSSHLSIQNEAEFVASVNRSLLYAALVIISGALLAIMILSRRILGPIEALTRAVHRMENGDLSQRVKVKSRDEIGRLTYAFNSMADGLVRLEDLRRNIVSDIAHELRTPLTNIRCQLETMQDGLLDPNSEMVDSLHEEAMLLNRMIDDLQELSLAEAGHLSLHKERLLINEEVDRAVSTLRSRAAGKHVVIAITIPTDLPCVYADPKRVGQILRNLLNNALTHSVEGGHIEVKARVDDSALEVTVLDTGRGISPEHLANVFERFYRVDQSRERTTGGAGLGLAIVKQLVILHGGRIWVESVLGGGSSFVFTLPLQDHGLLSNNTTVLST